MRSILSKDFVLRANRRNYTKRQWRRLWPRILEAARHHNINPHWTVAPYEVTFVMAGLRNPHYFGACKSISYADISSLS